MCSERLAENPPQKEGLYVHHEVVVDGGQAPLRMDKYLSARLAHVSRHKLQQSITHGLIKVNGRLSKASYKVKAADTIHVYLPTPPVRKDMLPERMDLSIVYEDDALLIVDKPAGLVVHPACGNWTGTLLNGLLHHLRNDENAYPFLVHRLDKGTSGLLVVAKTEAAMCGLARQFFLHTAKRRYYALIWGHPEPPSGTIDLPLQRSPKDRRIVTVSLDPEKGKQATTHYTCLRTYAHVSLLSCQLETGRTHQIRAHLKHLGHPLFNDQSYGGDKALKGILTTSYKHFLYNCWKLHPYQALHAKTLGLIHPNTQEPLHFESPLPQALQRILDKWETYTDADSSIPSHLL